MKSPGEINHQADIQTLVYFSITYSEWSTRPSAHLFSLNKVDAAPGLSQSCGFGAYLLHISA